MIATLRPTGRRRSGRASMVATALLLAGSVLSPGLALAQDAGGEGDGADATEVTDAERQLAERHLPVMMLQTQPEECSLDGEPFLPMPVDAVLDNPEVALRQEGPDGLVALWGPTAADLHAYGPGFYLDFPGAALRPGCTYERDGRRYLEEQGLSPTVYAHVTSSDDVPGVLALQYWFFFYYNDWNNKHESDWEGIQLLFRASSAEEALATEPYSVGYAQHEGGERAGWDDEKLTRDGDRPFVYTSARSHASYFSDAFFLGRGASEGFGCDDTTAPSTRVDPAVVVLPERVTDPSDPLAWLEFRGRWGERHDGAFDSPTGLRTKGRWNDPVAWHDRLRDGSVTVPAGDTAAGEVIDTFCRVVQWGSGQVLLVQLSPLRVLLTVVALAIALRFLLSRTAWGRVPASPVVRRRRAGELVRASLRRFRDDPLTFLGVGALAVPLVAAAGVLVAVARAVPVLGDLLALSDTGGGSRVFVSALTGGLASSLAFAFVIAGVAAVLDRSDRGTPTEGGDVADAVAAVRAHGRELAAAVLIGVLVIAVMLSTIVLVPLALWLLVRWQLTAPVIALEGRRAVPALRRSGELVRRRWWHTLLVTGVVNATVLISGTVVALVVLTVFSSLPLWFMTVVVSAVGAVVMPVAAIAVVLLYGDARAAHDERTAADTTRDDASAVPAGAPTG